MFTIHVIEVGEAVDAMKEENMLILFGATAPQELKELCVIHDGETFCEDVLKVGGALAFGNKEYQIVEVGDVANANFGTLGHLTINFSEHPGILPGSIRVMPPVPPDTYVGETLIFA